MKYKAMTQFKCLVFRFQLTGPGSITVQSVCEICRQQSGNKARLSLYTSLPLLIIFPPRLHTGVVCQHWNAEWKHPVSPHNYNYSTNPHLMFSFNGPHVNKLSAECPPFQFHLSLATNSTYTLPKMQNRSLGTTNTARTAQTVEWLEYGPDNLGFNFWQRQDIPTLQNTDTGCGACPAYSKGQWFFPCRLSNWGHDIKRKNMWQCHVIYFVVICKSLQQCFCLAYGNVPH
jgi:hypothetical protein